MSTSDIIALSQNPSLGSLVIDIKADWYSNRFRDTPDWIRKNVPHTPVPSMWRHFIEVLSPELGMKAAVMGHLAGGDSVGLEASRHLGGSFSLAQVLLIAGHYEQAAEVFKKLLKTEPLALHPYRYQKLGEALVGLGRYEEAVESFKKSIELEPDGDYVYYELGRVLEELGRTDEARATFMNFLKRATPERGYKENSLEVNMVKGYYLKKLEKS